jgi:hypothetical protein
MMVYHAKDSIPMMLFFDVVSCVGIRVLCGLPCTSCAHDVSDIANLITNDMAAGGKRTILYQLAEKLGWFSSFTASGGLFLLLGDSSSGASGLLVIEAPDPLLCGDVLAVGHLAWLVRSVIIWHVSVPNVLLMVPLKSSDVLSSGRWSASRTAASTVDDGDDR